MCCTWAEVITHEETPVSNQPATKDTQTSGQPATNYQNLFEPTEQHSKVDNCLEHTKKENGYEKNYFVAAVYDKTWYIGKIIDIEEAEVETDFMKRKKVIM